jgi:hypothetical protein
MRQEKKMSEQQQHRELRKPGTLINILTIAGIIVGFISILVGLSVSGLIGNSMYGMISGFIITLDGLFGIHTNGDVYGIVGEVVLILVVSIPCILIGLMVFRGFKNKASSRTVVIVAAAFFGIVGGFIVEGALVFCYIVWIVETQCC